ncbi:39S ribosomal protein L27, mitochondrial [Cataglyphis hispanica]|uniref:39S ribosomal protein L27, mitochondrial n=1 Tax=Cataglyphis hispanica TaxID=1086592 RepID=UPI00217F3C7C|nr:39S ribosomal protein L27, mitochondrial [Cataglyphis hispanica]XP_050465427.1 39S ribosomal protein L27, mitochondrial [Cataglyphis hispanica]XP_050465428.1 39S ribosomal protein L27, mitochondrial [Cataglyphis hispanica]
MAHLSQLPSLTLQNIRQVAIGDINNLAKICVRYASKKASSSTSNKPGHPKPKHRGWKKQDGSYVQAGTILATQLKPRFHPGLNVGFGRNGTLFAIEAGKVMVTCEKINPNWNHSWIKRCYAGREGQVIYKKHFNIIPDPQHDRFQLIDRI